MSAERLIGSALMLVEALLALGALAGLEPLDRLAGDAVVAARLQVATAGFSRAPGRDR